MLRHAGILFGCCWMVSLFCSAVQAADEATPIDRMIVMKDFKVERLYSVPKDQEGSWVSMCVAPEGDLIVCDQYGGLFRLSLPGVNGATEFAVTSIPVDIGEAQGLLCAFDSLYVVVNKGGKYESGLYRCTDSDGDGEFDTVKTLRLFEKKGGEHGPHAVLLSPDGESLHIVCGNQTKLPEFDTSRVPTVWDEDLLMDRVYGRGFMKGVPAPGGWICKTDPEGKEWEVVATGFRNEYDAAFNRFGDLFAYDADMEWDMNTPWYRPTRVNLVASGAEFGWRNGSGKWPAHYEDSLPAVLNIGPGSPTGVTFGYGAKFPLKYQDALFICDWSYGKLYAVHMEPEGAAYKCTAEEFITGTPLPLTDIVINPKDGAMYFAIGGRRTQSGLYKVTYTGDEETGPFLRTQEFPTGIEHRHQLEAWHAPNADVDWNQLWKDLGSADRYIRFAARIALEHQPIEKWQDKVFTLKNPHAKLMGLMALTRHGDASLQSRVLDALGTLNPEELTKLGKITAMRVLALTFIRLGEPTDEQREAVLAKLEPAFPTGIVELDAELCRMLVYLQSPNVAKKAVALLEKAPTQEQQIDLAKSLRNLEAGWNMDLRKRYFSWFVQAQNYRGGASFGMFVDYIKKAAVEKLTDKEKQELEPILNAKPEKVDLAAVENRPVVKDWKMDELVAAAETGLKHRDFENGRRMFAVAKCFACHRFDQQGGAVGPDLSGVSGRFNIKDLLESMVEPNKVISDQYSAVTIVTDSGKVITGRIVNLNGDTYRVNTDMLNPDNMVPVKTGEIVEMVKSEVSMMPGGLLNTLNEEEILDLMAYLLSRGDRNHQMFAKDE